ncbi:NAD(P)-dependent oxidoreductase [Curvibacter sp. HBC61]|uniref:NAD(P)-dependent oxidoreductase n=1 Tax=Curvibacter cyanobacteriorum TaxID=3026422 RepID=A0ABT5N1D5_9BURK|nr:NAD(P)-dependent oxidoreductase [Curvibacter sp. HBC61]MDD0840117.1 NAD(P)-dependent oxidoreductase [Curvibacter sp. HBC61]
MSTPYPSPTLPAIQGRLAQLLPHLDAAALDDQTLFITGGTGFFGYWLLSLLDLLQQRGHRFRVRLLSRDPQRFQAAAPYFADRPWIDWVSGDVRRFEDPRPAELLIHAATDTHAQAHTRPLAILDDVLLGTRNTLQQALAQGVKRALFVSSGAVYGPAARAASHTAETTALQRSLEQPDPYGEAKAMAELWCHHFGQAHGLCIPVARCFAFVGAGLDLNGHFAIGNFIRDGLAGQGIHVQGDGTPVRSYLYGADLAVWLLQLLLRGDHGRAYNVGSDQAITIEQLAHQVNQQLSPGQAVTLARQADLKSSRSCYVPDIERARQELRLDVWTPLAQAIAGTADPRQPLAQD